jgi:RNA polymerase sigma-70 factor (ECF subfamily)
MRGRDSAGDHPERLIRLGRTGDGAALGRLLELYRDYLTLLARLHLGQQLQAKVDASDLVQEVFLEAHRHFDRFEGTTEAEVIAWLRQVLAGQYSHLVRRYCGTQRRYVRLERQLDEQLDQSSRTIDRGLMALQSSPSQRAARSEQGVLLANALQQLPTDYREVIILRHLQGLSFAEIARQLGRSVDSVEKLWVRGLDRLRRIISDES